MMTPMAKGRIAALLMAIAFCVGFAVVGNGTSSAAGLPRFCQWPQAKDVRPVDHTLEASRSPSARTVSSLGCSYMRVCSILAARLLVMDRNFALSGSAQTAGCLIHLVLMDLSSRDFPDLWNTTTACFATPLVNPKGVSMGQAPGVFGAPAFEGLHLKEAP